MITIILYSYNRPKMVQHSIHSVLWQTFEDWELFVIDNSTDEITRHILERFKDPRIKIFYEDPSDEERRSKCIISEFYNKYTDMAHGKYVFQFSDDDILLPNCLEEAYKYAESSNVKCCYVGQFWMDCHNNNWSVWQHRQYDVIFNAQYLPRGIIGAGVFVRKDVFAEIEKPYIPIERSTCPEADGIFLNKLAIKFGIHPVGKTLLIIRFHEGRYGLG